MPHTPYSRFSPSSSHHTDRRCVYQPVPQTTIPARLGGRHYDLSASPPPDDRQPLLVRRVITSQPKPMEGCVGIDIDALEAETALDTSDTYYFGEDETPPQRQCTEFCVVDMGVCDEEEPSVCKRAIQYMKEHPYKTAAIAVGAGALALGGGYLLHQALSGSSSNNDESSSTNTADQAGAAESQSSSSQAADEALLGAVGGNGTETASAPSHEGAHARVARAARELTRLSDDTILYIKNKGWFTTHCRLECEKSGWDGKPIKYSSKYIAGGGWSAFHIPGGSENCVLKAPYLKEQMVDSTLPSSQVNGNKLHEMHLWGPSWGRQWSWQRPRQYASSEFPMFQEDLTKCISHRSVYSCRGGFPRPKQFEIGNRCLDTLQVTVNTKGKVKYSEWGFECSDYYGNKYDNPCIEGGGDRSGEYKFWATLHGGEKHLDYGCWSFDKVVSAKREAWKYTW